jgi:hypothetical protein
MRVGDHFGSERFGCVTYRLERVSEPKGSRARLIFVGEMGAICVYGTGVNRLLFVRKRILLLLIIP